MPFDFDAAVDAPFRMQPGLRRLHAGAAQLTPSRPGSRHLREKLAVLGTFATQALLVADSFDAKPAIEVLLRQAAAEHPASLIMTAGGSVEALALGWRLREDTPIQTSNASPETGSVLNALSAKWRLTALLSLAFEEDFAIVDGATATVPWLAVCLPSHWAPETKVGRHFAAIHAPVADNALLLAAGERLLRMVCGPERWERFVWSVTRHPRLHAHPAHVAREPWPDDASAEAIAASCFFRSEHQTFIPLPERQQAVFTIHVELQPLAELAAAPDRARRLAQALATMSDAVLEYRGLAGARERLVAWLHTRS